MEADLADREYDLINTRNQYESQKMTLADLMFWPVGEELEIEYSVISSEAAGEVEKSADSVVAFALDHNPAVQIASWQALNAKRELNTAKWQTLPSIGLYAGWNTSYYTYQGSATATFRDQFRNNMGEYVELSLSTNWTRSAVTSRVKSAGPSRTATAPPRRMNRPAARPRFSPRLTRSISRSWSRASSPRWSSRRRTTTI